VIVLGNEKGGSGKSTVAMHLIIALIKRGFSVASIDLDAGQGTLSRYIENRDAYMKRIGLALDLPEHRRIYRSHETDRRFAERSERMTMEAALSELRSKDFVVIDTAGSDNSLSRLGHGYADTLITPMNDSFLDLDLLAHIDSENHDIVSLSSYGRMILTERQQRIKNSRQPADWIVMRNRLTHVDAQNKREMAELLDMLSRNFQFRVTPGFGERVIFRDLFIKGLTLLDLRDDAPDIALTMSHVAARQEVRDLLQAMSLPLNRGPILQETRPEPSVYAPRKRKRKGFWGAGLFSPNGRRRPEAQSSSENSIK
jgi:chromosome partitioning protein